jgi:hypothetical protein
MRTSDVVKALQELGKGAEGLPLWAWYYMPVSKDADKVASPTPAGHTPCTYTTKGDRPRADVELTKDDLARDASHYFVFGLEGVDAELRGQYVRLHEDVLTVLGLHRRGDDDWVVEVQTVETCRIRNMGARHEVGQAHNHLIGQIATVF